MIPVHFAVDLEPDARLPHDGDKSFDSAGVALETMAGMRRALEKATGAPVQFGWYIRMDRQITALYGDACAIAQRYWAGLETAAAAGDEIGLHVHCFEPQPEGWRVNYSDDQYVAEITDEALETYAAFFGKSCRAVRMGDMWTNDACQRHLASRGVEYDLSLEPGMRPRAIADNYPGAGGKGDRPSMLGAPLKPFRPFEGDAQCGGMWEIPLASYRRRDFLSPRMWALSGLTAVMTGFRRIHAREIIRPQAEYRPAALRKAIAALLAEDGRSGICVAVRNFGAADRIKLFLELLSEAADAHEIRFCNAPEYVRLARSA